MVSAKWVQENNLDSVFKIREEVFVNELLSDEKVTDDLDTSCQSVLLSELRNPVGTGRLVVLNGKYTIDKLCVLKEYRGKNYAELIIRMIVRKAHDSGAEKTLATIDPKLKKLFKKIGFEEEGVSGYNIIMAKYGDVRGDC